MIRELKGVELPAGVTAEAHTYTSSRVVILKDAAKGRKVVMTLWKRSRKWNVARFFGVDAIETEHYNVTINHTRASAICYALYFIEKGY